MLHYKSDVVEPESVAEAAVECFTAACNEVEYEMGRLCAWFSPSFFLNDNINTFDGDGELRLTIMATLAQDESRKTSIRVKSGQQTSMDNGVIYGNGNILGYTRYEWKEGDKKHVEMRINPEQAKTVRTIFDMYLAGEGLIAIKYDLEKLGYKTSTGTSSQITGR